LAVIFDLLAKHDLPRDGEGDEAETAEQETATADRPDDVFDGTADFPANPVSEAADDSAEDVIHAISFSLFIRE
jgi:hypothetical protein